MSAYIVLVVFSQKPIKADFTSAVSLYHATASSSYVCQESYVFLCLSVCLSVCPQNLKCCGRMLMTFWNARIAPAG